MRLDKREVERKIAGRAVIVTGAGGSIGSELCQQLERWRPEAIVALDRAENYLLEIEGEMRSLYPSHPIPAMPGDVLDSARVRELIRRHRVQTIFHPAAYKHVPLVENSVFEAVAPLPPRTFPKRTAKKRPPPAAYGLFLVGANEQFRQPFGGAHHVRSNAFPGLAAAGGAARPFRSGASSGSPGPNPLVSESFCYLSSLVNL